MSNFEPTGRRRFRSERKWGKERLILQVEVRGIVTSYCAGQIDSEWQNIWRDAKTSDLTVAEKADA